MTRRSLEANTGGANNKSLSRTVRGNDAGQVLLEAISNSTTRMDQIVLRRIGLNEKPPRNLK